MASPTVTPSTKEVQKCSPADFFYKELAEHLTAVYTPWVFRYSEKDSHLFMDLHNDTDHEITCFLISHLFGNLLDHIKAKVRTAKVKLPKTVLVNNAGNYHNPLPTIGHLCAMIPGLQAVDYA
jgi:hypothetical protein